MNFLAHAYLSFGYRELLVGNMIGDFVKGKSHLLYAEGIQKGIVLHRRIDAFTDAHEAVQLAKLPFREDYRLYSAPIIDILFDHFLANDEDEFPVGGLQQFAAATYDCLEAYSTQLPLRFLRVFAYMKAEDWLYHYRNREMMARSLYGLARRAMYMADSNRAFQLFIEHYDYLQDCYKKLLPDVKIFSKETIRELNL
jgi:acyl carrier protein phosphodiesterase